MGHKKVKTIEALLKKPNLTVEDVLDFDSVLQKAKNREEPLMDYLSRSDHIHELLNRIVKPNGNAEKNLKYYWAKMLSFIKVLFRYPFIASELLNCISEDFFDYLEADLEGLDVFWKFLGNPGELDPNLTIYLAKTLMLVLLKRPKTIIKILKEKPETFQNFLDHLELIPIADFLCRLIEAENNIGDVLQWLNGEHLFQRLMELLSPEKKESEHFALYQFANGLFARSFPENFPIITLLNLFTKPTIMDKFLTIVVTEGSANMSILSNGLDVVSEFIRKISDLPDTLPGYNALVYDLSNSIIAHLDGVSRILDDPTETYKGPAGKIPAVGIPRLKVARFFADLALLNSPNIVADMMSLKIGERLVDMFFAFPSNNFLHSNVCDLFANLCHGDWMTNKNFIIKGMIRAGKLLSRITSAQRLADSLIEMPRGSRPTYMGHVTLLSDQIHGLLDRHGAELYKEIGDLLRTESWIEYSNKSYRETKLNDSYLLGGEPAPTNPQPVEEVFTSIFSSSADENIIRYFCHEIVANFPASLHLTDLDASDDSEDEDAILDDEQIPAGIGISLLSNTAGFENIMDLDLEMKLSLLDDDDFDLGTDSEEEHMFGTPLQ